MLSHYFYQAILLTASGVTNRCTSANLLMTKGATGRETIQFAIMPAYSSHPDIAGRVLSVSKFMKPVWLLGLPSFVNL
jgi:hypothetical protein